MRKKLLLLFVLTNLIVNAQNNKLIKEIFFKQSIAEIETIAIANGFNGEDYVFMKVFFKCDLNGNIFDINVDNDSKIFESEIVNIINQIPKLDPKEYIKKGEEMKYGLKIFIKLPSDRKRKKRIKKGKTEKIKYKGFYVKEYFPVKWIDINQIEKSDFLNIEAVPITENCKSIINKTEIRECVSRDIQRHIGKKFDVDLAQDLGLQPGKQRIVIHFIISKLGEIVNVEAEGAHEVLLEEGIRAVNSLPDFHKPGTTNGKPVNVKYTLPISFIVQ